MACFIVEKEVLGHYPYDEDQIVDAVKMVNAIAYEIEHGAYKVGARNNIAVDLCCMCHVLDLDSINVFSSMVELNPDMYWNDAVIDEFAERAKVIDRYLEDWDTAAYGVFDYTFTSPFEVEDDRVNENFCKLV